MPGQNISDVVIIGGVAAGPKAGATLARRKPEMAITLFQREEYISYGSCGLPYFASGDINSFADLTKTSYGVERTPDFFKQSKGITINTFCEVTSIDRDRKIVTVKNLKNGTFFEHGYRHLVIATGARPKKPPFPVADSPAIAHFTRPEEAIEFRKTAQKGGIGSAVIIGGGYIGCEIAEAMGVWGIETTLVECEPHILPATLDPEMAAMVRSELEKNGVTVATGCAVKEIRLNNGSPEVVFTDRDPLTVDHVFICTGVSPESSLAEACGLEIGSTGGIVVDDHMRTSDPAIYAGGDCVELRHRITGDPVFVPLGSLANRHGRIIAENISGNSVSFPGVLGAALVKVCDKNVGSVGLTEKKAAEKGFDAGAVWASFPDKPDYYPESKEITVKIIYSRGDRKLLGLQAVGDGDICRRVDVYSSMLQHGAAIEDLLDFEHGYAPPYSEALDPLHHCASLALALEKGLSLYPPCSDREYYRAFEGRENLIWLDLREEDHFSSEPWPSADTPDRVNIPLNALRSRLETLDGNHEYLLICGRGSRSYQAWLILNNAGIKNVHVIGGGLAAR